MNKHNLIAIVDLKDTKKLIQTKFFYTNEKVLYDVTNEICQAIFKYNEEAIKIIKKGKYRLYIPIHYKNGFAEYEFGFGATHVLQQSEFFRINKYIKTFPLDKCHFKIFMLEDIQKHFKSSLEDNKLKNKVHSYLYPHAN